MTKPLTIKEGTLVIDCDEKCLGVVSNVEDSFAVVHWFSENPNIPESEQFDMKSHWQEKVMREIINKFNKYNRSLKKSTGT